MPQTQQPPNPTNTTLMTTMNNITQGSRKHIPFLWQDAVMTPILVVQKQSQYTLLDFATIHTKNEWTARQQSTQKPETPAAPLLAANESPMEIISVPLFILPAGPQARNASLQKQQPCLNGKSKGVWEYLRVRNNSHTTCWPVRETNCALIKSRIKCPVLTTSSCEAPLQLQAAKKPQNSIRLSLFLDQGPRARLLGDS